ncbi:MAG: class I SAM-dependent methyltransferase [Candidatus Bathyarchaeota archaeon]|nr:class I SAM-dependent methyltransferase [Candidatus Bathyarchaeota archaeon]MDH5734296.1 class I SAM-dependent methyltransferase [Candidatus Bathyarchaeota archaeon]
MRKAVIGMWKTEGQKVTWTHSFLHEILEAIPVNVESLIDVGCGKGIIGALVRIYRDASRLVGVDIFKPYLTFCKIHRLYDEIYRIDLRKNPLPFKSNEFEVATCIEVIEHIPKTNGDKLLKELERISKTVIMTTPAHSTPSKDYDNNPHRKHVSLWNQQDLQKRGYRVKGVGNYAIPIRNLPINFRHVSSRFPPFFQFLLAKKEDKG